MTSTRPNSVQPGKMLERLGDGGDRETRSSAPRRPTRKRGQGLGGWFGLHSTNKRARLGVLLRTSYSYAYFLLLMFQRWPDCWDEGKK